MSKIIAIDLGTVNSVVSASVNGEIVVIPNNLGADTTPSAVAFTSKGERLVGQLAKRQQLINPENSFSSFKRLMGHTYQEIKNEKTSYKVKPNDKGHAIIECPHQNKDFTPEELSGFVLSYLKQAAEDYLGESVDRAIVTVPAYFDNNARESTKVACTLAGMKCERILNEPTAAALAYGSSKDIDGKILIYDLGGGTFDVTLLEVSSDDELYQVIASSGNSHLGGDDFDNKIVDYLISEFKKTSGVDLSKDKSSLQRLKEAAERAKCELSSQNSTNINIPYISAVDNNPLHLNIDLSRAKFESLIEDLLERMKGPVNEVIQSTNLSEIKEILLVGGSTRVPCVVKLIEDLIGIKASKGANVDLVVSEGAAKLAQTLQGEGSVVLVDVTPLSLGVEINGGMVDVLIPRNTTIPTGKKSVYTTATQNQTSVTIHILQGERPMAKDNKSIGTFNLSGIAPAPARVPQIEVSFDLDTNGILSVSAKDLGTGNEQKITITQSSNLSKEEIERMIQEAKAYSEADRLEKEFVELKNNTENLCNSTQTVLENSKDKVDENILENVKNALEKTREALKENIKENIERERENLIKASHALSEVLYRGKEEPSQGEVIEGEVIES